MKRYNVQIKFYSIRQYEVNAENEKEANEKALLESCKDFSRDFDYDVIDIEEI